MKKILLAVVFLYTLTQIVQAQEEIVKWTFPINSITDTVQNGTNLLNPTRVIRSEGTSAITIKNGATNYAAQATGWDNGKDSKNWNISFITAGYDHVQISSKQQAGGTNGGPKDFKLQFKVGSNGTWADVAGGNVTLANDWTTGVISNLDLPSECQDQSKLVYIRWIMTSNTDASLPAITPNGVSKIDDIIVAGMLITGLANQKEPKGLSTFPNPSLSTFSIATAIGTSIIEIYNSNGQLVYKTIPENEILPVYKSFPVGLYFIKATSNGKVSFVKHIVI